MTNKSNKLNGEFNKNFNEELTIENLENVNGGAVGVAQYSRMVKERFEREKKELQSAGN